MENIQENGSALNKNWNSSEISLMINQKRSPLVVNMIINIRGPTGGAKKPLPTAFSPGKFPKSSDKTPQVFRYQFPKSSDT